MQHKVSFYDSRFKQKMEMLRNELWGWTNPSDCKRRASKEGQFNIHVHNLFVALSPQLSAAVLQVKLDNRKV
jgi:hypothetical protein